MGIDGRRKLLVGDFAGGVTLHGFRFLVEERGFRRFLWFTISLGSVLLSAMLSYTIFKDFLEYKTITFTTTNYDVPVIHFPTITICPINYVSKHKINNLPGNITSGQFLRLFAQSISPEGINFSNPENKRTLDTFYENNITTVKQMVELYQLDMVYALNSSIFYQVYDKICLYDNRICTVKDFKTVATREYTICWQFNSYTGDIEDSLIAGEYNVDSGLSLTLDLHAEESVYASMPFEGIVLYISNYGSTHLLGEYIESMILPVGSLSSLKLSTRKTFLLREPYPTRCGEKDFQIVKKTYPYSKVMCQLDCLVDLVYQKCHCVAFNVEELVDKRTCELEEMYCYRNEMDRVIIEESQSCKTSCPQECSKTTYNIRYSQVQLGTSTFYRNIRNGVDEWKNKSDIEIGDYVRRNLITIKVAYSDFFEVTETVNPAVTWTTLVGTIGGSIGLCLGFSSITFFEFLFFAFDYLRLLFKKDKTEKPTEVQGNQWRIKDTLDL